MYAVKQIRNRKIEWDIRGPVVYFTVYSQSRITTWSFTLDFNDYGHITGRYWRWQENYDSSIPDRIGDTISETIHGLIANMPR